MTLLVSLEGLGWIFECRVGEGDGDEKGSQNCQLVNEAMGKELLLQG